MQLPMPAANRFREGEPDEIVVTVQHHQERGVFAASADAGRLGATVHQHAKTFHAHVAPFLGFHLGARGIDPERGASALAGASPRQKSRTVSRNLSFHSAQPGGKSPTW
jgi:hypothetical protein